MIEIRKDFLKGKLPIAALLGAVFLFTASLGTTVFFMTADYGANIAASAADMDDSPVIVIDAGHGGIDAGASAADGTSEKEINLSIALNLKEIAESYGAEVILTREGDMGLYSADNTTARQREDLLNRKEVMEEAGADLAISIHLNSFPGDSSVRGPQVFYPAEEKQRTETAKDEQVGEHSSKDFAEAVQESLEINLPDGKERKAAAKGDILLFQNPPCKIILVECGFLSNAEETVLLKSGEYQQKLAEAIWEGMNKILGLEIEEKTPLVISANNDKKSEK